MTIKVRGLVKVNGRLVKNQVVNIGIAAIVSAISSGTPIKITNMFVMSGFPFTTDYKATTFASLPPYVSNQSFVGDNSPLTEYPDLLLIPNINSPFHLKAVGVLPADKANGVPIKNAAAMVINGDPYQSASLGTEVYTPTGNEMLFSVVHFADIYKSPNEPFVLEWEVFFEN